jgi:hypothetical protein
LIEASISQQYGIRFRKEMSDMTWDEVRVMISGLLPETPLGRIISIRSEENADMLKAYNSDMLKIRSDYRNKQASKMLENTEQLDNEFDAWEKVLGKLFS